MKTFRVALCGNPNVGKSTVFNALTGLHQHTGNWAGKTVDTSAGTVHDSKLEWELIDLPGAYSLFNGSPEEIITSDYLTFQAPDAVIVVCDATCLERNLNLALQIAQACPKTLLCINMLDEAKKQQFNIDLEKLENLLGVPVTGITASRKEGLLELKEKTRMLLISEQGKHSFSLSYPQNVQDAITLLEDALPHTINRRFAAIRALTGDHEYLRKLEPFGQGYFQSELLEANSRLRGAVMSTLTLRLSYQLAEEICSRVVAKTRISKREERQQKIDRLLTSKCFGIPVMALLLALILYLTITGANVPSEWLSQGFTSLEPVLFQALQQMDCPEWMREMLVSGVYRVTGWVISVMLPPMAIFFPLFTLLEDLGFLPRIAFNLDKCFQRCCACGKQALCMCMGLGCNAVGVMGCRIIQSPRERMIALLTNSLMPCNGRFPALLALVSMFLCWNTFTGLIGTLWMTILVLLCIVMTFFLSWCLSRTVLKGIPSAFTLELPPFRTPQIGQIMIRSVLDRTLFVLGRAVAVAAPAGLVVWILANLHVSDTSLLRLLANWLNPLGRLVGLDGVILLSFVLGFPANEIVLPIMMMIYLNQGQLTELAGLEAFQHLLIANGWTTTTGICVILFTLFHWPCSTTTLTIWKETKSIKWTTLAVLLPTFTGFTLCFLINTLSHLFL